jgi:hypothetical protein
MNNVRLEEVDGRQAGKPRIFSSSPSVGPLKTDVTRCMRDDRQIPHRWRPHQPGRAGIRNIGAIKDELRGCCTDLPFDFLPSARTPRSTITTTSARSSQNFFPRANTPMQAVDPFRLLLPCLLTSSPLPQAVRDPA